MQSNQSRLLRSVALLAIIIFFLSAAMVDLSAAPDQAVPESSSLASTDCAEVDAQAAPESDDKSDYDPLAKARARRGLISNMEAGVPAQCYTATGGESNPCYTCHTAARGANFQGDWDLQEEYAFSDFALTNRWSNLFVDRSEAIAAISDEAMLAYIRSDNYTPLREAMQAAEDYSGYVPDLNFNQGFDDEGFALDGSHWRAFRYKPFLGTFWPTNGSTDDVIIRLPEAFRSDENGDYARDIYKINLALLEAAMTTDPNLKRAEIEREIEPVSEVLAGVDLDDDGELSGAVTRMVGLPDNYVGGASDVPVNRYRYPEGTEFLHTVRYIDMDSPNLLSNRMKEVRYMRKNKAMSMWATLRAYELEDLEKEEGNLPQYRGSAEAGLQNSLGWLLQGFIEDEQGRLRLQTDEETRFCMGCHSAVGVTVDQTFGFARKAPGADGWQYQNYAGIPDVPQIGHDKPEILTYFERVGGGDEFRANDEILAKFFVDGVLDEAEVLRAAPGGDLDIGHLITPSEERAALLNKAYMALVAEQSFEQGRDTIISPPANVHPEIENVATDLSETGQVYKDGVLWLDWEWGGK